MFSQSGLALMLLESAVVDGRSLPAGALGTEEDFGDDLERLLRQGILMPFDPWHGIPPVPSKKTPSTKAAVWSYAYADGSA